MFGVETIGNYDVKNMGGGKYSVALNNGNIGACIMDKAGVDALREKYNKTTDSVEISKKDNEPKTEQKQKKDRSFGKAVASFFLTGLGQFCDGRIGDGFKDIGLELGLGLSAGVLRIAHLNSLGKAVVNGTKMGLGGKAALAGMALVGIGFVANKIHSVVDAYKGSK